MLDDLIVRYMAWVKAPAHLTHGHLVSLGTILGIFIYYLVADVRRLRKDLNHLVTYLQEQGTLPKSD
jgi:hypothetical protein